MPMSEHLSLERISELLDAPETAVEAGRPPASDFEAGRPPAPDAEGAAEAHLEACATCRAEYERMSRMRMALSAMAEADPPPDEWPRVLERLEAEPSAPDISPRGLLLSGVFAGWPLRAAAALLLFAGGVVAGLRLTGGLAPSADPAADAGSFEAPGRLATAEPPTALAPADAGGEEGSAAATLRAIAELREMGAPRWAATAGWSEGSGSGGAEAVDPVAAAERLARLDALIQASYQAVEESPADPVANGLLFQLVDERNALASRLRETLHLTSLEYR